MRLVPAFVLATLFAIVVAQDPTTDTVNDHFNSIETKPSVRLDPYIRKALLKALSDLEEGDQVTTDVDTTDGSSTVESELLKTGEDITENSPTQTPERIQIHSFVVNGQSAFANSTNVTPTFIDNNISILSTTAGNVENQVTATLPTQSPQNIITQTKDSGINVQQVRSIQETTSNNIISSSVNTKPTPSTTTTSTTTTSTTPRPTHNKDGENIEDVDKRDVQVFQAPLVAAFTVHQDAQGLPKKVVPIFQQQNIANTVTPLAGPSLPAVDIPPQAVRQQNFNQNNGGQPDFISHQLALQKQLEEKQRILEEQLRLLQFQQRQQEEMLRKQQFFFQQKQQQQQQHQQQQTQQQQQQQQQQHQQQQQQQQQHQQQQQRPQQQQQEAQRQQQIQFEQQRIQAIPSVNNFQVQGLPKNNAPNQFVNQNNGLRPQSSQVSIQASVPLDHPNGVTNQQQLPNREAVDFLIHLRNQQNEQFPLQENHLPHGISNFLQPNFNQQQNFNQIRQDDPFRQKQGNRVFRQESGVGNFGFNTFQNLNQNQNRFNTFNPIFNNRFFPATRQNQFNPADIELKQLLVQTGLNARSPEDLNIVSKVLSLNHGVPINNNVSNRLPFDSRRHIRTL